MSEEHPLDEGGDVLDELAQRMLEDLESEPAPPARGIDWIRSTLRSGGAQADPLIGTLFQDKYRILRRIGKGGFGAVYEAVDERGAKNRVALKVQLPGFAPSPERLETFRREAMRVTRLQHPNIVDWKSFDETPDGGSYFVMELLDGVELSAALREQGAFGVQRAQPLLLQILGALRAAHFVARGQSILHLDLKPKNILLLPEHEGQPERVKVIDFGIGQFLGEETRPESVPHESIAPPVPATRQTPPGSIDSVPAGTSARSAARASNYPFEISHAHTAEYASPEHCVHIEFSSGQDCEPQALDGRSDLYSFGVVAYELLTGRRPYPAPAHRAEWLRIHQQAPIEPWGAEESSIPPALRRFVERCLEKDPDARFADSAVALEELERIVHPPRGKRLALAAVALVLVGVVIAQLLIRPGGRISLMENGSELLTHHHGPSAAPWILDIHQGSGRRVLKPETLLHLSADSSDALDAWNVKAGELAGQFEVRAPREFASEEHGRRLFPRARIESRDGLWRSDPFDLVWLGKQTTDSRLRIGTREVGEGSEALVLDPQGMKLALHFPALQTADLDAADWSLMCDGESLPLAVDGGRKGGARVYAALDGLPDGPAELELRGHDRAGVPHSSRVPIVVQRSALDVEVLLHGEAGTQPAHWSASQRRSFFAGEEVQLGLRTNRVADLHCPTLRAIGNMPEVVDSSGTRLELAQWLAAQTTERDSLLELELTDRVLHDAGLSADRHRQRIRLPLRVLQAAQVAWEGPLREEDEGFGPREPGELLTNGRQPVRLHSAPALDPARYEIELSVNGAAPLALAIEADGGLDLLAQLPRDGEDLREGPQNLRIATYVLDALGERATLNALSVQEFRVLVDRSAPHIPLPSAAPALVRGLTQEWQIDFPAPHDEGSPVALHWQVFGEGSSTPLHRGQTHTLSDSENGPVFRVLPLHDFGEAASWQDGLYAVQVRAVDRAGNSAFLGQVEVEFARRPPVLTVKEPAQEVAAQITPWTAPEGKLQPIVVHATDINGVERIECSLYRRGEGSMGSASRHFRADPVLAPRGEKNANWSWTFDPPPSWSRAQDVMILLRATDVHGQIQIKPYGPLQLPHVRESYPARIAGMWLIPGNPGARYAFQGRASVVLENRCFTRAGLPPIWVVPGREKPGEAQSAWNLTLEPDALEPYYLAEREVNCEQLLRFLRDRENGYMQRAHWPTGTKPIEQRRQALIELYAGRPTQQPATELWHSEASAYARAAGMRLPTLLELTFAIRGGSGLYRAQSWDAEAGAQARTASPWQRVRGLSSGAEWTSSPVTLDRREGLPIRPRSALDFLPASIPSRRVAEPYWISGTPAGRLAPEARDLRADFAAVDVGDPQHWSDTRLGFRLARSADEALAQQRGVPGALDRSGEGER